MITRFLVAIANLEEDIATFIGIIVILVLVIIGLLVGAS